MNDLHDLLHDAVADVEPTERLAAIRARTAAPPSSARPWLLAAGAAVLATAAAVTAFAVVDDGPHPHDAATDPPTSTPSGDLVAAYYLGETASGPRLFREFARIDAADPLDAAVQALTRTPADRDYSTPWPQDSIADAGFDGVGDDGVISVVLDRSRMLHRPDGLSRRAAELAVQQVVYTFQAALQTRAAVEFYDGPGVPATEVYGVAVRGPVTAAPQNDVLNLMSISDPAEGTSYDDSFVARGRANSFEATVHWQLRVPVGPRDGPVMVSGSTTATGWGDRLYPWEAQVDLTDVAPGTYVFVAVTDDPSGGAEGRGAESDTRTITVR